MFLWSFFVCDWFHFENDENAVLSICVSSFLTVVFTLASSKPQQVILMKNPHTLAVTRTDTPSFTYIHP